MYASQPAKILLWYHCSSPLLLKETSDWMEYRWELSRSFTIPTSSNIFGKYGNPNLWHLRKCPTIQFSRPNYSWSYNLTEEKSSRLLTDLRAELNCAFGRKSDWTLARLSGFVCIFVGLKTCICLWFLVFFWVIFKFCQSIRQGPMNPHRLWSAWYLWDQP